LFGLCDNQEFHADALQPAPAYCGILNFDGNRFPRNMQEQRHLHSGEWRDQAFDSTAFRRQITDGTFVLKLVPLD
jgi:hypothetical protein